MELYVSQPRGYPANFPRQLQRVAKLYLSGFLNDESIVWINTNAISPVFWVFNGLGTAIYWFDAPTAGSIRVTKDRVRWAPSYRAAKDAPILDLPLASLNVVNQDTRLTVVVDNNFTAPGATVGIADGRDSEEMIGGFYAGDTGVAVVDLPRFDPEQLPTLTPSRRDYESALARYQGLQLLTAGMAAEHRADVVDNTDAYRITLSPDTFAALTQAITAFTSATDMISQRLFQSHHDSGSDD